MELSFASVAARFALFAADFAATAWFGHADSPFDFEHSTLTARLGRVQRGEGDFPPADDLAYDEAHG
jgi:hypothetical protein